jgi:FkbM family methyltransferase
LIVHTLLRGPGRIVPGWFPLVVEPLGRRLPPPPSPVQERVNGGRMLLDLDDYVQRKIWYRSLEPVATRALRRLLRPGDVAFDVGANVGYYTLLFASRVGPSGSVHAFEPVNGDVLEENVALSAFENVVVSRTAAGAVPGSVAIGRRAGAEGRSSGAWRRGPALDAIEVEQIALDDYVEAHVPGRIRLVKIDVEGMEVDVIAGLRRSLGRVDALLVEVAGDAMTEPDAVLEPLAAAGFRSCRLGAFGGRRRPGPAFDAKLTGLYHLLALRPEAVQ